MARTPIGKVDTTTSGPATVPVASIAHDPRNRRESYQGPAVEEMAASIKRLGLLQPLGLLRYEIYLTHFPDYEEEIGGADWVALDGNRRLAALRLAGEQRAPVHVLDRLGREELIDEARLVANIHREAFTPLAEAEALAELVDRHGSQSAVAERIGKSEGFVSQRLALRKLTPDLKKALNSGSLSLEHARAVAKLKPEKQAERLAELRQPPPEPAPAARKKTPTAPQEPGAERTPRSRAGKAVAIAVGPVAEMAAALREHLSTEDRYALAELLMD